MNTCLVITGLITKEYIPSLLTSYANIKHKIVSTWYNQDPELINILKQNDFIIVQDNYPENNNSTNYQTRAIYNGCMKAKELNYSHIIRLRTDTISFNTRAFIDLLEKEFFPKDKLICFCGLDTCDGIYFFDNVVAGSTNLMIQFYKNYQPFDDNRYIEKFLVEQYLNRTNLTRQDIQSIFNFCGSRCQEERIDFVHSKYNFDIINDYCKRYYSWA